MARRRRRNNNNNGLRVRRNRRRRFRRISAAPPRLLITSNSRRIVIPYVRSTVKGSAPKGKIGFNVSRNDIFSYQPNRGLTFEYRESRIHSIRVYFQSDFSTSSSGSICLIVSDSGENSGDDTVDFNDAITYPGAMVRRCYQNISNVWYPTEPSDRDFKTNDNNDPICFIAVQHSDSGATLQGRVVFNVTITMRGRDTKKCNKIQALLEADAASSDALGFESLGLDASIQSSP